MDANFWLGVMQIMVGALAVAVVFVGYLEYGKVRELREEMLALKADINRRLFIGQQAQQRIIASYAVSDPGRRIALLNEAVAIDPDSFNAYNALGYAHLQAGDRDAALAAFIQSTARHPEAKAGWFDVAGVYVDMKRLDLARDALSKAVAADSTARADALADARFRDLV